MRNSQLVKGSLHICVAHNIDKRDKSKGMAEKLRMSGRKKYVANFGSVIFSVFILENLRNNSASSNFRIPQAVDTMECAIGRHRGKGGELSPGAEILTLTI